MRTKTVEVDGLSFTVAELTLDDIEEWELATSKADVKSMTEAFAPSRRACAAAIAAAGITPPEALGKLKPAGLRQLVGELMRFSSMVATGEEGSP